jgi:hypothetical protein
MGNPRFKGSVLRFVWSLGDATDIALQKKANNP